MKLWKHLKGRMLRHPDQTVSEKGAAMTYDELIIFAERFAAKLNVSACAILCQSELSAATALLACFAAGVTAVPLSMRYGEGHCRKIIETINPPAIITDVGGELRVINIDICEYPVMDERPAVIMCTSGTTGTPKGVMISEDNLLTNIGDIAEYLDVDADDRILIARPIYHCAVLTGELLLSLHKGLRITFCSEDFNPIRLMSLIRQEEITFMCGTPTLFSTMASFMRPDDKLPLKTISVSGECLTANCAKIIRGAFVDTDIYNVYGLTEAAPRSLYLPPELFDKYPESVGYPLRSVSAEIVDENDMVVAPGIVGELVLSGGNIMTGYFKNPELTENVKRHGWLHTGDIAYRDKNGLFYIKGRRDNMIIRAGMNIYPQEIENALASDPRVEETLVYGIPDRETQKIGLRIRGKFGRTDEVRKLCAELLPPYQVPSVIEIVDAIPKNASGKKERIKQDG